MGIKIPCRFNDQGAWCTNNNIERSLFGFGARCCTLFPYSNEECEFRQFDTKKPPPPPPPPPKRIISEDVHFNINIFNRD